MCVEAQCAKNDRFDSEEDGALPLVASFGENVRFRGGLICYPSRIDEP